MKNTISIIMTEKIHQVVTELTPAIHAVFQLGFIPKEGEIVEFDEKLYRLAQNHLGEINQPLYQVLPRNPNVLSSEINMLEIDDVDKLLQGIHFFADYAKENQLLGESDEVILKHAAENLPRTLAEGTPFEQPLLKIAKRYEKTQTAKNEWMDFLEKTAGEGEIIKIRQKDEHGVKRDEIIAPTVEKTYEDNRMNYSAFKQFALKELTEIFKEDKYEVVEAITRETDEDAHEVIRIWEKTADGSHGQGLRISSFYEDYALGKPLEEIILSMAEIIKKGDPIKQIGIVDLLDFEKAKDTIIIRPLNFKKNQQMLESYVYKRHGDIALVIYATLAEHLPGLATTKVPKSMIKNWQMSEEAVFDWAIKNTHRLFPPYIVPLEAIQSGIHPEAYPAKHKYFMNPDFILEKSHIGGYHLFLEGNINAATAVFYHDALKKIAQIVGDDLYLIIASMSFVVIHEKKSITFGNLKKIALEEKTNPYADPAEFLSDGVYHYCKREDRLSLMYHKISK